MTKRKRGRPTTRRINRDRPIHVYQDQTERMTDAEVRQAIDEYLQRKSANDEQYQSNKNN